MRLRQFTSTTALIIGSLGAISAHAQSAPAAPQSSADQVADDGAGLGDIVVTAQRRRETVQTVPIAVSAFSAASLKQQGIVSTLDVAHLVPNMIANSNTGAGSSNSYFLRGLGSTESIATFDPPVGTYIDDVYLSRQNANNLSLFDVNRVEVLRGPQGTLFGRNTTGGAINVVMAEPKFNEFGGFAEVGYGSFDKKLARASVDIPLAETFAAKVSGYWQDDKGYVKNVTTHQRLNDDDGWGVRLGLRGELAPWARWKSSLLYVEANGENIVNFNCNPLNTAQCGGSTRYATTGYSETGGIFAGKVTGDKQNYGLGNRTQSTIVTSNLEFDVAKDTTLSLITGYVHQAQQYGLDFYDGRSAPTLAVPYPAIAARTTGGYVILNDGKTDQFSQEVKLNGKIAGNLIEYVAGLYYIKEDNNTDFADIFAGTVLADRVLKNSTEAIAGYAQADVNVTDMIKLTAGVRYTDETKHVNFYDNRASCHVASPAANCFSNANLVAANGVAIPTKQQVKIWTPRFAANFKPSDDILLYASATRGFKSGGWNARASSPQTALPFSPEKVWSYESGIKSQWWDKRIRANLTFFWMDVGDLQVLSGLVNPTTGAASFLTRNFADYRNRGIEAEFEIAPIDGLRLYANAGYQDDKYKINRNAPALDAYGVQSVAAQQADCLALLSQGLVPGGGGGTPPINTRCGSGIVTYSGKIAQPTRTPEFTVAIGGSYKMPIGEYSITPSVNANWQSKSEVATNNNTIYAGTITGTNGTFPANPYGGDFVVGSRVKPYWLVNSSLTLGGPDDRWTLSIECANCFDKSYPQGLLGYTYLNMPMTWTARARYNF